MNGGASTVLPRELNCQTIDEFLRNRFDEGTSSGEQGPYITQTDYEKIINKLPTLNCTYETKNSIENGLRFNYENFIS